MEPLPAIKSVHKNHIVKKVYLVDLKLNEIK
jgi:hypothetical protein